MVPGGQFFGVAAAASNDVWAVGFKIGPDNPDFGLQLIEHWNGTSWSVDTTGPTIEGDSLSGVTVVSSNNVWAVGRRAAGTPWSNTGTAQAGASSPTASSRALAGSRPSRPMPATTSGLWGRLETGARRSCTSTARPGVEWPPPTPPWRPIRSRRSPRPMSGLWGPSRLPSITGCTRKQRSSTGTGRVGASSRARTRPRVRPSTAF